MAGACSFANWHAGTMTLLSLVSCFAAAENLHTNYHYVIIPIIPAISVDVSCVNYHDKQ